MATSNVSADYSAITNIGLLGISPCPDTVSLFDCNYSEVSTSAVDIYIENCREINKLWAGSSSVSPEFSRLLLLGYVSAVESYFRTIISTVINTDDKARADAHTYTISFGAVLFQNKQSMAEALLEGISFASEEAIRKAFLKFLAIKDIPEDIKSLLLEFEKICHMRHCCVHRFGKLGTQNGIALGLERHKRVLEKPLTLGKDALGDIASWLMSFVKAINNFMFRTLLDRSNSDKNPYKINWTWNYSKDRAIFLRFYKMFASIKDGTPSPSINELYQRFLLARKPRPKAPGN
ncbi:hypothetical protein [Undibacterium fentianense]|uniref:RiboL-PSP-HEPN domain-containing protein n=1 Tax=Undibacterium fentianense TaxID=2828728 RepID=A0A941IDZ7_9BURK|nr:hypothetical protein [Undibacterium fentianense]MBR7798887.1 hypothetical protein [Undibacterium fentianense]